MMDALLSLPVLGYFLMPSLTTYSASLNLLFFYMTWSTLVLSHSPLKVEAFGLVGIRILFFLLPATLFLAFDSLLPSLAVGIKRQGASSLPTRTGGLSVKHASNRPQWYGVAVLSSANVLLSIALQSGIDFLCTEVFQVRSILKVTTTLPMPWSIAKDVVRMLVLREVLQYYIHRRLLHPARPTTLSKLHLSYAHAIKAPYAFSTHYDHPLPYLFHRFLPLYLPCLVFRTHLLTYLLALSLVTLEETLAHSGYITIPGILLGGVARRQDLHFQHHGTGNLAPWGLLDWLHGTGVGGGVENDVQREIEKHDLRQRGEDLVEKAGEGTRGLLNKRRAKK